MCIAISLVAALKEIVENKMKLYDIVKEFEDLDEGGDVRKFLKELVKHYKNYHKPAQKHSDGDVLVALGGKNKILPLYRRGMDAKKAAIYLARGGGRKTKGIGMRAGRL